MSERERARNVGLKVKPSSETRSSVNSILPAGWTREEIFLEDLLQRGLRENLHSIVRPIYDRTLILLN